MRVFVLTWHIYVHPLVQFTRNMEGSYWIRIPLYVLVSNSYPVVQCLRLFRIPFICFRVKFVSLMCFIYVGLKTSCQFRIQSCGFRVYFVFFSCGFVFSSFCACVSFLWGLESSCQIRIQSCSDSCSVRNRLCFIYVGCEKLVSDSYPVVRCLCFFRILLMRFRVQSGILLLFHLMWGPEISCQVRIHSCGVFMFSSYPACVSFMWGLKSSWQSRIQSCAFVFISYYSPVFSRMFSSTVRIPRVFNSCVVREFILNSCRALFAYSFQTRFLS